MNDILWKYLVYGWFIIQTVCIISLLETVALGKPYFCLFGLIYVVALHFNLARHPELPLAKKWPFLKKV